LPGLREKINDMVSKMSNYLAGLYHIKIASPNIV